MKNDDIVWKYLKERKVEIRGAVQGPGRGGSPRRRLLLPPSRRGETCSVLAAGSASGSGRETPSF